MESQQPQSLSKSATAKLDQLEPVTPGKDGEENKDAAIASEQSLANQAQGKEQNLKGLSGNVALGTNSEVR